MNSLKQTSQWRVVAASVCGKSHQQKQQLCQDAHAWQILPDNILIAAIADGAGSASMGKIGAIVAAQTAVANICAGTVTRRILDDDTSVRLLLIEALVAAKQAVMEEAIACEKQIHDLATTLIVLIATPEMVAAAQIGDGVAVVKDFAGNVFALTQPQNGEYINETTFLVSPDAINTAQLRLLRQVIVNVALLTDGLQMLALNMDSGTPHQPFFTPLFKFISDVNDKSDGVNQLVSFLRSERICDRADDDLTLLLADISN